MTLGSGGSSVVVRRDSRIVLDENSVFGPKRNGACARLLNLSLGFLLDYTTIRTTKHHAWGACTSELETLQNIIPDLLQHRAFQEQGMPHLSPAASHRP
ncbi:hypothetical protein AKJ16_DCAP23703 [Drosera capensis]